MEKNFWEDRWQNSHLGFHQAKPTPDLEKMWEKLLRPSGQNTCLVPLCGKSNDIDFLLSRGFRVTGVEFVEKAVEDFFKERDLKPEITTKGSGKKYCYGQDLRIWVDDLFLLSEQAFQGITCVFDRAALVAIAPEKRKTYAEIFGRHLEPSGRILMIAFEYPQEKVSGPPFSVSKEMVKELYQPEFKILESHSQEIPFDNPRFLEAGVDRMTNHAILMERV